MPPQNKQQKNSAARAEKTVDDTCTKACGGCQITIDHVL
jgi:hypothetical protein